MPDNRPTAVARNSNTFLPVNLLGFSLFGFLEAAVCGFDSPARAIPSAARNSPLTKQTP
jgi:hypothetical protein